MESLNSKRRPRLRTTEELPRYKPAWAMEMPGAPIPRQLGQSCSPAGTMPELMKKYEKRNSFTSVGRNTLVSPRMFWSAQADCRDHVEGYPFVGPTAVDAKVMGPTPRLPSCE